jgi:hypothetical protein
MQPRRVLPQTASRTAAQILPSQKHLEESRHLPPRLIAGFPAHFYLLRISYEFKARSLVHWSSSWASSEGTASRLAPRGCSGRLRPDPSPGSRFDTPALFHRSSPQLTEVRASQRRAR